MRQRLDAYDEHDEVMGPIGKERIDAGFRPHRRLPMAVVTILVMALFAGGLWFAYSRETQHSGSGGQGDSAPLIQADSRPTKVRPEQPGGMPAPDPNVSVYNERGGSPPVERLLPAAEQPLPRPMPPPQTPAATSSPPTAAAPAPEPPLAAAPPAPTRPAAQPARPASPAPATAPASPAPPATARSGPVRLQLAAVRSEVEARQEWAKLKREHSDLLGNLTAVAVRADLGDRGVFYRIQTQPFADVAAAERLCAELKRQKLGCTIAR
jgi:hypothetical protein